MHNDGPDHGGVYVLFSQNKQITTIQTVIAGGRWERGGGGGGLRTMAHVRIGENMSERFARARQPRRRTNVSGRDDDKRENKFQNKDLARNRSAVRPHTHTHKPVYIYIYISTRA